ncbi:MAG: Pr6Pr family membrane protein [bacterium]
MHTFFSLLIALLALLGLYLQSGLREGRRRRHMFCYYTNLSNLAAAVYRLLWVFPGGVLRRGEVEAAMVLGIFLTHLIYVFVLGPAVVKSAIQEPKLRDFLLYPLALGCGFRALGNALVHYIVPLLSVLCWLLCGEKQLSFAFVWGWLALPLSYLIFVLLRARRGEPLHKNGSRYPYRFMDLEALGLRGFARSMLLTLLGCTLLGLGFYLLSLILR